MRLLLAALLLGFASPGRAAFDAFLRVTVQGTGPAAGESGEVLYSGWSRLHGFESHFEVPERTNPNEVIRAQLRPFTIVKAADAASPVFFRALNDATLLTSFQMVIVERSPERVEMWEMRGTDCLFSSQNFAASGSEEVEERLTLLASSLEFSYTTTGPAGNALSEIFTSYDHTRNLTNSGQRVPSWPGGQDGDVDGLPNGWELFYGLNAAVANAGDDPDKDGFTNLEEYLARTSPVVPQSVFRLTGVSRPATDQLLLTWDSKTGIRYRIEVAASPGGAFTQVTVVTAQGLSTSANVAAPGLRRFFRVVPLGP